MNTKISLACLVTGLVLCTNLGAAPAAGGGGSGGGVSGARVVAPPVNPANRVVPGPAGNSGNSPGQIAQPGVPNPNETATGTSSTNSVSPGTNQMAEATNQMQDGNNSATANDNNPASPNRAVTPSDRILLSSLKQTVGAQLGVTSPSGMPVHFLIANGAVTLIGNVQTADQSQRILSRVQQTPGVLSVFNDLRVGTAAQTAVAPTAQTSMFGTPTDHAFSAADRSLLTAVQQSAGAQLGVTGASAGQMPVHFSIENGVVGVTGQVSSLQEKQALLASLQRISGVTRVVDNVGVVNGGGAEGSTGNANPFLNNNNNNLPPTSREQGQTTNSIFLNAPNNSSM